MILRGRGTGPGNNQQTPGSQAPRLTGSTPLEEGWHMQQVPSVYCVFLMASTEQLLLFSVLPLALACCSNM